MGIAANSIASGNSSYLRGANFSPTVNRLERKPILIGSFDPSETGITSDTIYTVRSAAHAGALFGFGFQLHRMCVAFFRNWSGGSIDVIPVTETSAQATGTITYSGTSTENKTLKLYIGGELIEVSVSKDDTAATVATAVAAAIGDEKNCHLTAEVNGSVDTQVDLTSKSEGLWGNFITVEHCLGFQEELPSGITAVVVDMADGAGTPDISSALNAMGTGTNQNENWYTGGVNGGGPETTPMDSISTYNGAASDDTDGTGNHDGEVGRFFQFMNAYTTANSLATLQAITALRKEDMTNGCIYAPGCFSHPVELACAAMAVRESVAINQPECTCVDKILVGIVPCIDTDDYNGNANLDIQCVKKGISTVRKDGSYVRLQDLITFYRPDSVDESSNIWRSMRHQAVSQNVQDAVKSRFALDSWKNITIVADKTKVTDPIAKLKAREIGDVIDELVSLVTDFEKFAWVYSAQFTIDKITESPDSYVTIRDGGKGFNYILPVVYSGEGGITSGIIQADANVSAAA